MDSQKILHRFKTVVLYGTGQILSVLSILILSIFIIRFHSKELWGAFVELLIWSNLILLFISFGSYDLLLKSFSNSPNSVNKNWSKNLMTRSVLLLPTALILFIVPAFNELRLWVLLWMVLQFLVNSFRVLVVFQRRFLVPIYAESLYIVSLLSILAFQVNSLNLELIIQVICISSFLKLLVYIPFFLPTLKGFVFSYDKKQLIKAWPFFILVFVGTLRAKMDVYLAAHFFDYSKLSKYQILIQFLMLAEMTCSFLITPYLKTFYRSADEVVQKIRGQLLLLGALIAAISIVVIFLGVHFLYGFNYSVFQYFLVFLFILPTLLHIILINQYYKRDFQFKIIRVVSIIGFLQIGLGYFLISNHGIDGALALKVAGQFVVILILWMGLNKAINPRDL